MTHFDHQGEVQTLNFSHVNTKCIAFEARTTIYKTSGLLLSMENIYLKSGPHTTLVLEKQPQRQLDLTHKSLMSDLGLNVKNLILEYL